MAPTSQMNPLWDLFILLVMLGLVGQFVLLIVRFDYFQDISFYWISTPVWIVTGFGTLLGLFAFVYYLYQARGATGLTYNIIRSIQGFIIALGSVGFAFTSLLLARKFEFDSDISFLKAMLPIFATLGLIALLVLVVIGIQINARMGGHRKKRGRTQHLSRQQ